MKDAMDALNLIRDKLVLPFVKESEQSGHIFRVDRLGTLVESGNEHNFFPSGLKDGETNLFKYFDNFYTIIMNNDKLVNVFEESRTQKALLKSAESSGNVSILMSVNRCDCSDYLLAIARGAYCAKKKFVEDKNPLTLYVAVMALEEYMNKSTIREEISEALHDLMVIRLHQLKAAR